MRRGNFELVCTVNLLGEYKLTSPFPRNSLHHDHDDDGDEEA
jgi:hypothetical protein